ncbi:MAG: calcium-binding protein, partial [Rhodobacteraceae bacterium]|nr:calcium-binding protein [Paracoccaceae bacterium]
RNMSGLRFGATGTNLDVTTELLSLDIDPIKWRDDLVVTGNDASGSTEKVLIEMFVVSDLDISGWSFVDWGGQGDLVEIVGDANDESITGSIAADLIAGNGGADSIDGGAGADSITGDGGADTIYGGLGADVIDGGGANDRIYGGSAKDTLTGGANRDSLYGGNGTDTLYGGADDDLLRGNAGGDLIEDGTGVDKMWGNDDADTFQLVTDAETDYIKDFEDGTDLIDIEGVVSFAELLITDTGTAGKVKVKIIATGELLFVQDGVGVLTAADLTAGDFVF